MKAKLVLVLSLTALMGGAAAAEFPHAAPAAAGRLTVRQVVDIALEANPQVIASRARWYAATHQIKQNYAPADPQVTLLNSDSFQHPLDLGSAALQNVQISQALQFPGKAFLQADLAKRNAEIARLTYSSTARDIRAQSETGCYQLILDGALADATGENVASLGRVLRVTQVAYSTSRVTQADVIGAQFDYSSMGQQERQFRVNAQNDIAQLNMLLYRRPEEPLSIDRTIELKPIEMSLDSLIDRATEIRQEILETALAEKNSDTALNLARMEYLPDYTLGVVYDYYKIPSFAPTVAHTKDWSFSIGFNVPLFFWLKQSEDVKKAGYDLEAARDDLGSIRSQTAAAIAMIYRNAGLAYQSAVLYRDYLIPLARQGFEVALVAYQSGQVGYVELAGAQQRYYQAQVIFLQSENQFLAQRVALEQTMGAPLSQ